jgi:hypothetical protein
MKHLDEFRVVVNKNISKEEFLLVTYMKLNNITESDVYCSQNERYSYHITEVENNKYIVVRVNKYGNTFEYHIYTNDEGQIEFDKIKSTKIFPKTNEIPTVTGDRFIDCSLFLDDPNNYIYQHFKTTKYEMKMDKFPRKFMLEYENNKTWFEIFDRK